MNREELEALKPAEIKKIAKDLEVSHHHNAGPAKIIDAIMASLDGVPLSDEGDDLPENGQFEDADNVDDEDEKFTVEKLNKAKEAADNDPNLVDMEDISHFEVSEGRMNAVLKEDAPTVEEQLAAALKKIEALESPAEEAKEVEDPGRPVKPHRSGGGLPLQTATQTYNPNAKPEPGAVKYPTIEEVQKKLEPFIARGLKIIEMDAEYWHIQAGNREASGNMKMPLAQFVIQANVLMRATAIPNEGDDIEDIVATKIKQRSK